LDALDLFGESRCESFDGSLWLFGATNGVRGPPGRHSSIEGAEEALLRYTGLNLSFERELIREGRKLVNQAVREKWNLAVVTRVETQDVLSWALLPQDLSREIADSWLQRYVVGDEFEKP